MKLTPTLKLRRIGTMYMVVDTRTGEANLTHVYHLNETAAAVWRWAEGREFTIAEAAQMLCENFEVDETVAQHDAEQLFAEWREFGLLQNE